MTLIETLDPMFFRETLKGMLERLERSINRLTQTIDKISQVSSLGTGARGLGYTFAVSRVSYIDDGRIWDGRIRIKEFDFPTDAIGLFQMEQFLGRQIKTGLRQLVENTKFITPVREDVMRVLEEIKILPGSWVSFDVYSPSAHSAVVITVRAAYDVNATAGVRAVWLYSPDGVTYDSVEDALSAGNYEDLTFAPGIIRQRTLLIPLLQPYVRVMIINLDTIESPIVTVWRTMFR